MKTNSVSKGIGSFIVLGLVAIVGVAWGFKVGKGTDKQSSSKVPLVAQKAVSDVPKIPVKLEPVNTEKAENVPKPSKAAVVPPKKKVNSAIEHTEVFGKSVNGTSLKAYVMGEGSNVTVIFGAFHGNEQSTNGVVDLLHRHLKDNSKLLDGKTVVLVPIVNPDGLKRDKRTNAHGVDINRNFPGTWKKKAAKARYNPGPKPASEPETKAVIALMKKYQPTKAISIHQPFHTMNYTGEAGKKLAQLMHKFNNYPITPDIGYPTPGSFGDYCGKTLGIAIVTLEMRNESVSSGWASNKRALLAAIAH